MARDPHRLYVECDGRVYLVERGGRLTFPEPQEVPFDVDPRVDLEIGGTRILFCTPEIDRYPTDWLLKDDIPARDDVDPLVRQAVNASLTREVAGAVLHRGDPTQEILLVKSNRGFTEGMWNIPGGFLTYGEDPASSLQREVREETNLTIEVEGLLGVYTQRFASPYFMRGYMFQARLVDGPLRLNPTEIEDARWFALDEAMEVTRNPFGVLAMEVVRHRGGPGVVHAGADG